MTQGTGPKQLTPLTNSQISLGDLSQSLTTLSGLTTSDRTGTPAGGYVSNTITTGDTLTIGPGTQWITPSTMGNQSIQPTTPIIGYLTLTKTGVGEFVLSGKNAQRLLMEYFEQAPEMWLRLMAVKAGEKEE